MKTAVLLSGVVACFVAACATGTVSGVPVGDGGIIFKGDASPSDHDGGTQSDASTQKDGSSSTCSGTETLCNGTCVDTSSDPSNCGGCNSPCDSSSTCVSGQCSGSQSSSEPPQGTCSHSLCTTGSYLDEGCDTAQCTVVICDPSYLFDDYCCDTAWDSACIDEVNTYCAPYSCQ